MKKMRFYPVFLLLLLVSVACKQTEKKNGEEVKAYNIKVQKPEYLTVNEMVRTSGLLATRLELKLSFKTGGIIRTMNVKEGQTVNKGTVMASLDLSEINAQVNQALIACEKAKRDYTRAQNLYRDSVATLEMVQNAKSAYDLSLSQKKIADFNLQHSHIVAPAKGKVQKILVKKDELIAPGYPAILFATSENDWIVRVSLTDKDIVKFSVGDSAEIQLDAFPEKIYCAEVSELGTFADPVTGTYEMELLLGEENPGFRPGFIARVKLFSDHVSAGLWVPFASVQNMENNEGYVYLLDGLFAEKRKVKLGPTVNDGVLILEGIDKDVFIVTDGASYLKDGSRVNVVSFEKAL